MKAYRSLAFGCVLASAWITGVACYQMTGELDDVSDRDPRVSISRPSQRPEQRDKRVSPSSEESPQDRIAAVRRQSMVERQLAARDITDRRILDAMRRVPRHLFVPENIRSQAYADGPLPIGHKQTISQPYIVGLMTQLAQPHASAVALDVGTGSGYQAAVLSLLCKEVLSIEIVEPLAQSARQRLQDLGYHNVTVRCGDGYRGWPEKGPFDLIIVAAAPDHIPQPLIDQLKPGGRLVIPVGKHFQNLMLLVKNRDGSVTKGQVAPVAFVPMTGEAVHRGDDADKKS